MKRIMITGASSGIGRAVALTFCRAGWDVGLIARRHAALAEIADTHASAVPLVCDVTQEDQVARAFADFGHVDVLFNNAGMFGAQGPIDQVALDDWRQVVDVNLTGMFLCARAAFAAMKVQLPHGGRIINNGSVSAHVPREGAMSYTTTKHAITGMTKSLSLDGRPFDIACGQIDIGNAYTDMIADMNATRRADGLPPVPSIDVQHIADAVLAMASLPLSANVQFQTIMATQMPYIGRG
jgi:NAD(P)-dependent dehydrogenase (short-subunit alcohol dehydrogenase family)